MSGAAGFGVAFGEVVEIELLACIVAAVFPSLFGVACTSGIAAPVSRSSNGVSVGSPLACRLEILSGLDMFVVVFGTVVNSP